MNPSEFAKLTKGLSSNEIIAAAIECGFLENKDIMRGDEVVVPRWLAEILQRKGVVELVTS